MYKVRALVAFSIVVFLLLVLPIAFLVIGTSVFPELGGTAFSFLSFISGGTNPSALSLIATSLEFSLSHAVIAVALALVYAWIVTRTDLPLKRFFELLPILGLTMPLEVKAFAWVFLLNQNSGILNAISTSLFGPSAPVFNINSMAGLIFVAALGGIPLSYLIIMPAMKSIDSSFEEASRVAGHGIAQTAISVTSRLLLPAIASAFLLVTIGGLANFDYPFIIGEPAGIHVLATEVYYYSNQRSPPAYGSAGVISIVYVIITLIGLTLYIYATRRTYRFAVVTGKGARVTSQKLRRWKPLAFLVCVLIMVLEFALPFTSIVLVSVSNVGITNSLTNLVWNFPASYVKVSNVALFYQSLTATVEMGVVAAVTSTAIGSLLSFVSLKSRTRGARLAEFVTSVPLGFPGVVYGISLYWMFLLFPGVNRLYGTIIPLVIALTFVRLPYSTRIISGNLVQISNELEEASQVAGSRFSRTFFRISMPLVREGLISSFVYTFVDSLRELGAVIILVTPGAFAFTTLLLDYYESNVGAANVIAAGSVILTLIIIIFLGGLGVVQHFYGRNRHRG